jgi:hypothetical protein
MADVFTDLLKRYTMSEFIMEGFCLHLSRNVWLDLTASSSLEISSDAVEDIDFRFTAKLEQSDLESLKANTNGTTALEICTIMTKRVLAGLCKELLQEARRRLFNSKTMADMMVSTLILPPDDASSNSSMDHSDDNVNKSIQVQRTIISSHNTPLQSLENKQGNTLTNHCTSAVIPYTDYAILYRHVISSLVLSSMQ